MSVINKQSIHQKQKFRVPQDYSTYYDSSQYPFDDNDYSTNIVPLYNRYDKSNSEYNFDIIPGNFSSSRVYISKKQDIIISKKQDIIISKKQDITLSDDKLTNIHEELANTKKSLNEMNKKFDKLKLDLTLVKEYGPALKWAKNYVEHQSHNYN